MKKPIPESYKKVLLQIAKEGPQTKYEIEKKTTVNHASIHDAVKYFIATKAFEGKKVGFTRTGQAKTKYKITLKGLCNTLADSDQLWWDMDKYAERWSGWLPILDYYDVFEKHNVLDSFKWHLQAAIKDVVNRVEQLERQPLFQRMGIPSFLDDPHLGLIELMMSFTNSLLRDICFDQDFAVGADWAISKKGVVMSKDLKDRWIQVLRENPEFRQLAKSVIERNLEDKRRELKVQEARLKFLDGLEKQ
jgi:hypothetical protein